MALSAAGLPAIDDAQAVRAGAESYLSSVAGLLIRARDIRAGWQALGASYQAPEASLVLRAMDRPEQVADGVHTQVLGVRKALDSYADRLTELKARRDQLAADIATYQADVARDDAEVTLSDLDADFWKLRRENALEARIEQLAADRDAAYVECGNAIRALFSDVRYSVQGQTSVNDPYQFGMTADGYAELAASGDAPWGFPSTWKTTNPLLGGYQALNAITVGTVQTIGQLGGNMLGLNGEGAFDATWSGLWQLTQDVAVFSSPALILAGYQSDAKAMNESAQRLKSVAGSIIGWGKYDASPWATGGQVGTDILLTAVGGAGVVKAGATGMARGASVINKLSDIGTLGKAVDLAGAARVMQTGSLKALDGLEKLQMAKRTQLGALQTFTTNTSVRITDTATQTAHHLKRSATDAVHRFTDTFRPPPVAVAGIGDLGDIARAGRASDPVVDSRVVLRETDPVDPRARTAADGSTYIEGGKGDPRHTDTPREWAGSKRTGALGAPPAGRGDLVALEDIRPDLAPKAHRAFGQDPLTGERTVLPEELWGKTVRIEERGATYYINDEGVVDYVDIDRAANPRTQRADLNSPMPGVTYRVNGNVTFTTDKYARTIHTHVEGATYEAAKITRNTAGQAAVRGEVDGEKYDAGHLLAHAMDPIPEKINLVKQHPSVNRNGPRWQSIYQFELDVRRQRKIDPSAYIVYDMTVTHGRRPTSLLNPWEVPPRRFRLSATAVDPVTGAREKFIKDEEFPNTATADLATS